MGEPQTKTTTNQRLNKIITILTQNNGKKTVLNKQQKHDYVKLKDQTKNT